MLHILWLALKFIGILLAVALAVLLLAAALILFCPLAYRVKIKKDADWQVWGRASWLFGLVSVTIEKEAAGFHRAVRICGVRAASWKKLFRRKKRSGKKTAPAEDAFATETFQEEEESLAQEKFIKEREDGFAAADLSEEEKESLVRAEAVGEGQDSPMPAKDEQKRAAKAAAAPPKENFIRRLWTRIVEKCRGIRDAFFRFISMLRNMYGKINVWRNFMGDARTGAALQLTWQQLLRLLRHAGPQKWKGYVNLGFENPAVTGQALAALGAAYPLHRGRIAVNPVWDRAVLEGEVFVRGRVFGIILLHMAGLLYFDKDVKYAVSWFRRQEG